MLGALVRGDVCPLYGFREMEWLRSLVLDSAGFRLEIKVPNRLLIPQGIAIKLALPEPLARRGICWDVA